MYLAKASKHILKPQAAQLFREPIHWISTAHYLGVTLDTRLAWSTQINQVRKKSSTESGSAGTLLEQEECSVRQKLCSAVQADPPSYDGIHVPSLEVHHSLPFQETAGASVQVFL
jgi:hypothetical protein